MLIIGTVVEPWGEIVAVGHVGERYYWLLDDDGTISMIPAPTIEEDSSQDDKQDTDNRD